MSLHETKKMENHCKILNECCRICARRITGRRYDKNSFYEEFGKLFGIELNFDLESVHPKFVCPDDARVLYRFRHAKERKESFTTDKVPLTFKEHDESCDICFKSCVRPKSIIKKRKLEGKIHKSFESDEKLKINSNVKTGDLRCSHTNLCPDCMSCVFHGFVRFVLSCNRDKKTKLFAQFVYYMTSEDLAILAHQIGLNERKSIKEDSSSFALMYKDVKAVADFNPAQWLEGRNEVIKSLLCGLGGMDSNIRCIEEDKSLILSSTVEQVYKICTPNLISPFAFLQNVCIYTLTGSKTAVDLFGKTRPSGGYKTIFAWLYEQSSSEIPCPTGETLNVFDNEQVVGRKSAIKPNNKAKVSIITNKGIAQLEKDCVLQQNEKMKPLQILKKKDVKEAESRLIADNFETTVMQVIDQDHEMYGRYESLHFEQLHHFIEVALKCVVEEQNRSNNSDFHDHIDDKLKTTSDNENFTKCANCGTMNPKRKLICLGCKEKEGIKKYRALMKENTINEKEIVQTYSRINCQLEKMDNETSIVLTTSRDVQTDERYDHITSNHKGKKEIVLSDPVFCNPNSFQNVAYVLRQIGLENNINRYSPHDGESVRHWTFVCCDGVPYMICKKLKEEAVVCMHDSCGKSFLTKQELINHVKEVHPTYDEVQYTYEFDWFYLRIGAGHYEMNLIRSFFEMNWIPFLEKLCEDMGFVSDAAKLFAKNCKDLHKSWHLLLVFHIASLRELVLPYVRECILSKQIPTPKGYLKASHDDYQKHPNRKYLMDQVFRFSQGIINFRMATRRNNSQLLHSAKFITKELFYSRVHPKYQQIELHDHLQYLFMPDEVKELHDKYASITTSGNHSCGEDFDFILEEKNRQLKQWISKGIPTDSVWRQVCRNNVILEEIKRNTFRMLHVNSECSNPKRPDLEDAIDAFRTSLRKSEYLNKESSHTSLKGTQLDEQLINFLNVATIKRIYWIRNYILQEDIPDLPHMSQPTPITPDERRNQEDINNKTKSMIEREIMALLGLIHDRDMYEYHQQQYQKKVKGKKKAEYIAFHTELTEIVNASATLLEQNSDLQLEPVSKVSEEEGHYLQNVIEGLLD